MAKYLLSVTCVAGQTEPEMSEEQMAEGMKQIMALESEMRKAGAWVFGGNLHDPDTATVVRSANGDTLATDGPFVESKEFLGGFYIIDAADLDAAVAWAGRVTALVGKPIEVRPFAHVSGE